MIIFRSKMKRMKNIITPRNLSHSSAIPKKDCDSLHFTRNRHFTSTSTYRVQQENGQLVFDERVNDKSKGDGTERKERNDTCTCVSAWPCLLPPIGERFPLSPHCPHYHGSRGSPRQGGGTTWGHRCQGKPPVAIGVPSIYGVASLLSPTALCSSMESSCPRSRTHAYSRSRITTTHARGYREDHEEEPCPPSRLGTSRGGIVKVNASRDRCWIDSRNIGLPRDREAAGNRSIDLAEKFEGKNPSRTALISKKML